MEFCFVLIFLGLLFFLSEDSFIVFVFFLVVLEEDGEGVLFEIFFFVLDGFWRNWRMFLLGNVGVMFYCFLR